MSDHDALAFLVDPAGRGITVLVLGAAAPDLRPALWAAVGSVGLVCVAGPAPLGKAGVAHSPIILRAAWTAVPVHSHVADVVVLTDAAEDEEPDAVVEEVRRLLAPGGVVRALAPVAAAYRLLGELHAAAFRNAELVAFGALMGVRARGPR